jgi:hypothetical protein
MIGPDTDPVLMARAGRGLGSRACQAIAEPATARASKLGFVANVRACIAPRKRLARSTTAPLPLARIPSGRRLRTGWVDHGMDESRTERDSNPRYAFTYTRFPGVRLQPLGHLSNTSTSLLTSTDKNEAAVPVCDGGPKKRTGRDSNSRYPCRYAGFRDRCIQPLCHLSRSGW